MGRPLRHLVILCKQIVPPPRGDELQGWAEMSSAAADVSTSAVDSTALRDLQVLRRVGTAQAHTESSALASPTPSHLHIPSPVHSTLGDAPPSPSSLTDIILSLHASLYGEKRSVDDIREMVTRYYDYDAGAHRVKYHSCQCSTAR